MDHLENEYENRAAMCEKWGISPNAFRARLSRGWTLEQALTQAPRKREKPARKQPKPFRDPTGQLHKNMIQARAWLGLDSTALNKIIAPPAEQLMQAICKCWNGRSCGRYKNLKPVQYPWFQADTSYGRVIVHFQKILDEYHTIWEYALRNGKVKHRRKYVPASTKSTQKEKNT